MRPCRPAEYADDRYHEHTIGELQEQRVDVGAEQDQVRRGRSHALPGRLDRQIRQQQVVHAKVHYLSDGTSKYQEVLIKDGSFRVGDTKFTLLNNGKAQIKNVVTDPATGSTYLDTAYATLQK